MKKSTGVVGVIVVLGAAYLGTTWYVGKEAQKTVERVVAQANERFAKALGTDLGGSSLTLKIDDYQRRFFSSDVTYTLSLKDEDGKPIELILRDHLQHGPFPVDALRVGDFMPMLAYSQSELVASPSTQKWFDSQNGKSPVHIDTRIGFAGTGKSVWTFSPTELVEGEDKVSFSGGTIDVSFSNDFNDSTSTGRFDSFALLNEQTGKGVKINNFAGNSVASSSGESDVKTKGGATIDSMVIGDAGDSAVTIEKLSVNLDSQQKDKLLDGSVRYDFGRLVVGDKDVGSLSVGGSAQKLDVDALTALAAEYDAIQAEQNVSDDQELVLTDAQEAVLRQKLMDVLASNPAVAIDHLVWKNAKGESRAALALNLAKPSNPQEQQVDVLLAEVLKRVKLDLTLSKPMFVLAAVQALGGEAEMMAAMIYDQYMGRLDQTGLVKVEGDTATTAILYENNQVDLNGQKMSVAEFMQRAMSMMM
jgi:uncharacterized protein YdgA (DUF945 family)